MENHNLSDPQKPLIADNPVNLPDIVLQSITEYVCVLGSVRTFVFMNDAMRAGMRVQSTVEGKTFADLPIEEEILEKLNHLVDRVFETAETAEDDVYYHIGPDEAYTLSFIFTPVPSADGSVSMVVGVGRRKHLHQAEADLHESKERQGFLLRLSDALRPLSGTAAIQHEATRLLGEYLDVDRAYYAACNNAQQLVVIEQDYVRNGAPSLVGTHFYEDFEATVKPISSGNAFIAEDVLEMPETQGNLENYLRIQIRAVVAMPLMKNGEMVACLAITSSVPRNWKPGEIALIEEVVERTWEAVERGRSESALQESEKLMSTVFDSLPVAVGLIEKDGRISLNNQELQKYFAQKVIPSSVERAARWKAWDADGEPLDPDDYPEVRASRGESVLPGIEMLYTPEEGEDMWAQVAAVPLEITKAGAGRLITVITNIDPIKRTKKALQDIEQQFQAFVATSSELVYRMSADWQTMYNLSGNGFLRDTGQPSFNWLESYIPKDEQLHVKSVIAHAIETKSMFELEHRVNQSDGKIGWVMSRAIPLLDHHGNIKEWLGAANDITLRKTADQQLKNFTSRLEEKVNSRTRELNENRGQLQSILDTTLIQMSILQAVRDDSGQITDFRIAVVNRELERETGRTDLVGKLYSEEYPGIKKTEIYDLIIKTVETGQPHQTEYYYPYDGFNKWFSCMFVKLNDGVVATNMDISDRKLAEQEQSKNYLLLRQSEDVASLGSWDYDLSNGVFSWSDGMYRLFDMKERRKVSPDIYLRYTTDNGRRAAERVVRHINSGDTGFAETLEMNVNGQIRVLNLKAMVLRNEQGQPIRVLGVDIDITASRAAEEKIRQIEARQQELIFRATLASQEEERRRISESLHNGLGQLLYGIKISMSHLTAERATNKPETYASDKKYTESLLKDAIAESRRISHELAPRILEDFGISAAIEDACQQLGKEVKFDCKTPGLEGKLDKYLELAVFRIIQELLLNIVKHSGATKATLEAGIYGENVKIKVVDNGCGMKSEDNNKAGIGLATIRSKVKLLNGTIKIESQPGKGTQVSVHLPL